MSLIEQEMEENTSDTEATSSVVRPDDIYFEPAEARAELFTELHKVAHKWATKPGDLTVEERCNGTVHGVLSVLSGVNGNLSDGSGLPNYQISVAASDDYNEARGAKGLPQYDSFMMLDWTQNGGSNDSANLADEYAKHYDRARNNLARSAAHLFD